MEQEIAKYFWSLKDSVFFDAFSIISGRLYILITSSVFIIYATIRLKRKVLIFIIAFSISVIVSDILCYRVLKPAVKRLRPAIELNLNGNKDRIIQKHDPSHSSLQLKEYSMPSNHASNSFAFFIVYFFLVKKFWSFLLLNSILISSSRIFIVKHYPSDVLAGIVTGLLIGLCIIYIFSIFGFKVNSMVETTRQKNE